MGLKGCVITLDNQWNTYYPGQTINGKVDFTFDATKKVRGIYVKFHGGAETKWTEHDHRKNHNVTIPHTASEEYFSITYYLLGSKSGSEIELPAGSHSYPFTCALPPTLPSSFEGEHGHIRYTVKVTLDRPWKFDQETKMGFTVVSHMDLNTMPQCNNPIRMHMEKHFCCCWCKSGPLTVDISLPVSGYCPGQGMPIDISVENGSKNDVKEIVINFKKNVKYHGHLPLPTSKKSEVVISTVKIEKIDKNSSKNIQKVLEIPQLPPSNLVNCGIIDLDYSLEASVICGMFHFDMHDLHDITLGTVPLIGFQSPPITDDTIRAIPDVPPPTNDSNDSNPTNDPTNPQNYPPMNPQQYPPMNPQQYPPMNPQQYPPADPQQYPPMNPQQYPPPNPQQYPPPNQQYPPPPQQPGIPSMYPQLYPTIPQ